MSFNTVGEVEVDALVNDGATCPKFSRCGRSTHTVENCTAKYRNDGTMFHNMEETKEVDYDINSEVSTAICTKHESNLMLAF